MRWEGRGPATSWWHSRCRRVACGVTCDHGGGVGACLRPTAFWVWNSVRCCPRAAPSAQPSTTYLCGNLQSWPEVPSCKDSRHVPRIPSKRSALSQKPECTSQTPLRAFQPRPEPGSCAQTTVPPASRRRDPAPAARRTEGRSQRAPFTMPEERSTCYKNELYSSGGALKSPHSLGVRERLPTFHLP